MTSWCNNLELLIKSRTSLIWIKTKEEERLEKILHFLCERLNIRRFVSWDIVSGIKGSLTSTFSVLIVVVVPVTFKLPLTVTSPDEVISEAFILPDVILPEVMRLISE